MPRILTGVMAALFLVAAVLQLNDPDPIVWMAIYAAAALACVLALGRGTPRWLTAAVGVVAVVWAATLAPRVLGAVAPGELFREMGMATLAIEEAREMLGLLIVGAGMLALLLTPPERRRM